MASSRALRVLIVDDDDADVLMIEEALLASATPPVIDRAADGGEALDYLRRRGSYSDALRPDLVLLDLNMPRVGGLQVLLEIKNDAELQSIPVVVLTTSDTPTDVTTSYIRHANAYVTKPLDLDSFESAVRQIGRFYSDVAVLPQ